MYLSCRNQHFLRKMSLVWHMYVCLVLVNYIKVADTQNVQHSLFIYKSALKETGADLGELANVTPGLCASQCVGNQQCGAFQYNKVTTTCSLFDKAKVNVNGTGIGEDCPENMFVSVQRVIGNQQSEDPIAKQAKYKGIM